MNRQRKGPRSVLWYAVFLVAGGVFVSTPAWATEGTNAALLHELRELRSEVHALSTRVDKLEQMQHPAPASPAAAAPAPQPQNELDTEVHQLRAQVKQLQAQQAESAKAAQAAARQEAQAIHNKENTVRDNWHKIAGGMSQDQVAALLGQPAHKFMLGNQQVWYYVYPGSGSGSVIFSPSGQVVSRQSPPSFGLGFF